MLAITQQNLNFLCRISHGLVNHLPITQQLEFSEGEGEEDVKTGGERKKGSTFGIVIEGTNKGQSGEREVQSRESEKTGERRDI